MRILADLRDLVLVLICYFQVGLLLVHHVLKAFQELEIVFPEILFFLIFQIGHFLGH